MSAANAPEVLGIYETHLPVRNLDTSIAFYQDKVGLDLAHKNVERDIAFFWVGGKRSGMLGLWGSGSAPLSMTLHFAFRVSKPVILGAHTELTKAGITPLGFKGEAVTEPVVIGWMPAISIYFKDPDGHSIEMLHVLDAAPKPEFGVQSLSAWDAA